MKKVALALVAAAAIFSGCRDLSGVRGYWYSRTPDISNYSAAEDEFAEFAELAVAASLKDANYAVDMLLKKAAEDEVTYYVYTDLISRAFSLIASPCHNCDIFVHAADNILSKGILSPYSSEEYRTSREFCLLNRLGEKVLLPQVIRDGAPVDIPLVQRTLFLVVDQDCSTCRKSMSILSRQWSDLSLVALCYGRGPLPEEPLWDCYHISRDQKILDVRQGPFWFISSDKGTIEVTYSPVNEDITI